MMNFSSVVARLEQVIGTNPSICGRPVDFGSRADHVKDKNVHHLPTMQQDITIIATRAASFNLDGAAKGLPAPVVGLPTAALNKESDPNQEVDNTRSVEFVRYEDVKLNAADKRACIKDNASDSDDGDTLIKAEWLAFRYY